MTIRICVWREEGGEFRWFAAAAIKGGESAPLVVANSPPANSRAEAIGLLMETRKFCAAVGSTITVAVDAAPPPWNI